MATSKMDNKKSIIEWKAYFHDRGLPADLSTKYIDYIHKLNKRNVPVIFELEHLANLVGIQYSILVKMVNSPESFYRTFTIPKKSRGVRLIQSPYPSLLDVQRWIYQNILLKTKVHGSAHGFVHSRSIFSNASAHLNQNAFFKVDLKDFFPSIKKNWVINYFRRLGYTPNVSVYLASLCCYENALSQGAVTSPYLSNIVCRHLDNRLSLLASSIGATYTRYADDIAFSSSNLSQGFTRLVKEIIEECSFTINENKTYLSLSRGKRILTGLSISKDRLALPREYKRKLRTELYYITKFGYLTHTSRVKIKNPFYLDSILGKLHFWNNAEPNNQYVLENIDKIRKLMALSSVE